MNEKEFRKSVKQAYYDRPANKIYLIVLVVLLAIVFMFIFINTETGVGTIEHTLVIQNRADADTTANEITQGLTQTGDILTRLETSAGG